jgi:hypothetical protein
MSPKDKQQQRERREQRQPRRGIAFARSDAESRAAQVAAIRQHSPWRLSETLQHPAKRARSRVG